MKKLSPFNRLELLSSDLNFIQDAKELDILLPDELKDRLVDHIIQPGILAPNGINAVDIQSAFGTGTTSPQFAISVSSSTNINIGVGIAYNAKGERIEIIASDTVTFNVDAPDAETYGFTGITPFSTGHLTVPSPDLSTVSTRYVFISYLSVVRTVALPPDHNNQIITGDGAPSIDARKPITGLDQSTGLAYAHHRINGYKIIVGKEGVAAGEVTVGIAGATPTLNGDADAIYLGRYELAGGPPATSISEIIEHDATSPRKIVRFKPIEAAIVPDNASALPNDVFDAAGDPTIAYEIDQAVTLQEHISTLGHGNVGPTNPHATALSDILEGENIEVNNDFYQKESLADGIVDESVTRNNPLSSILQGTIDNTGDSYTSTTWATIIGGVKAITSMSGISDAKVTFTQLAGQITDGDYATTPSIYIGGHRFSRIAPTTGGNIYVPFMGATRSNKDAAGTYNIFLMNPLRLPSASLSIINAQLVSLGLPEEGTLLIGKVADVTVPLATLAAIEGVLPIAQVYWDDITPSLRKTKAFSGTLSPPSTPESPVVPVDLRTFGLIDTKRISTSAISSPTLGMLAKQNFYNLCPNPVFLNDVDLWSTYISTGTITAARITSATDSTMLSQTDGPKTTTAVSFTLTNSGNLLNTGYGCYVAKLKPNTVYTVTAFVKIITANCSVSILGKFANTSYTVDHSNVKVFPVSNSTTTWQRISATFTTNTVPSPVAINKFMFQFVAQNLDTGNPNTIYMTDVVIAEGEWVIGSQNAPTTAFWVANNIRASGTSNQQLLSQSFLSTGQYINVKTESTVGFQSFINVWRYAWGRLYITIDSVTYCSRAFCVNKPWGNTEAIQFPLSISRHVYLPAGSHTIELRIDYNLNPYIDIIIEGTDVEVVFL